MSMNLVSPLSLLRRSLQCRICHYGVVVALMFLFALRVMWSLQMAKSQGKWMREITVANMQCQGLRVRLKVNASEDTEFIEEGVHVHVNFAKVMSSFLYCDVNDLSEVVASGMDNSSRPDPSAVREVRWPSR